MLLLAEIARAGYVTRERGSSLGGCPLSQKAFFRLCTKLCTTTSAIVTKHALGGFQGNEKARRFGRLDGSYLW